MRGVSLLSPALCSLSHRCNLPSVLQLVGGLALLSTQLILLLALFASPLPVGVLLVALLGCPLNM